jgi:hypothetical protein
MKTAILAALLIVQAGYAAPAVAKEWTVMVPDKPVDVAKGRLRIVPKRSWNRSSSRPSERGETWTRDGVSLNELTFFAGIESGEPVYRQSYFSDKKLPRFRSDMLATDLVEMFEATSRVLLQSSVFTIERTEPVKIGQHSGVRFRYSYAVESEDLPRTGEAVALIKDKELFLVNFVAPSLYFFERDIAEVRAIIAEMQLLGKATPRN